MDPSLLYDRAFCMIVGQTINAYNHTLKARDIKVRLVGKIIVNKD